MPIPYFRPYKSLAVNTEIYINECLKPRLLPFIHKHHSDLNFQFVHDLAGAPCSIGTNALKNENLPFSIGPPVPQMFSKLDQQRTYGVFWHRKFMREDGRPQQELISRIQSQLKNFDSNFLQSLMGGVQTKLRARADRGVLASYKKLFLLNKYRLS